MRFLLATIDGGGTVPPELGLASRLVRRGHAVRVLADPTVEPGAHAARCAFSPWRRAPHVRSLEEQTALIADMERRNVFRQFVFARDRFICGPAKEFAADAGIAAVGSNKAEYLALALGEFGKHVRHPAAAQSGQELDRAPAWRLNVHALMIARRQTRHNADRR